MLKRFSLALVLCVGFVLAFASGAYANFGPHGGYVNDTDSCAGCHRAHTSFSTVGWTDSNGNDHASALLVGNATTMTDFCDACHGDLAPGASTNVASGVFDSGPSAASGITPPTNSGVTTVSAGAFGTVDGGVDVATAYQTDSTFGAPLNGGGFNRMPDPYEWQTNATVAYVGTTSAHRMDVSGPLWGSGNAVATQSNLTCTDCHDPHGSSNYRLLKAQPNPAGPVVGGYTGVDGLTPNPFVFSDEQGYPIPSSVTNGGGGVKDGSNPTGGWLKHADGAAQMADYRPNYTDTTGTVILHTDTAAAGTPASKSMSVWCSACHVDYNQASAGAAVSYNYDPYLPATGPAPKVGTQNFHRHPIDQTLAAGADPNPNNRSLTEQVREDDAWVPLEQNGATNSTWTDNYIGCLTCHRAHGSSSDMTGYAASHLETATVTTPLGSDTVYHPVRDGIAGVDPDKGVYNGANLQGSSALLRADNRGVCERCHNK